MLLAALAQAQSPTDTPQDKARIEGTLYNKVTGQPLRKATVSLHKAGETRQHGQSAPPAAYAVMTDTEGKFVFEDVDPGRYKMAADRPGYIHATYRPASGALLNAAPGQDLKDIRFPITPQGVIAGRVVDEDGDPLTEVGIQAYEWSVFRGARRLQYARQAMVDDLGNFRIANLEAGHYVVSAQLWQKLPVAPGKAHEAYVTTYYPSALDVSGATEIPLAAGAEASNIEIRMRKTRVFHVRGKLVDATGAAIQNDMALSLNKAGDPNAAGLGTIVISHASFDFTDVTPGSYRIETANNVAFSTLSNITINKKLFARYAVTVDDQDVNDISIALHTGPALSGTITAEGAVNASPTANPATLADPKPPSIALEPVEYLDAVRANVTAKADGTFEIHDLSPERYRIEVNGLPEGSYVKSIRMGDEDITSGILDLSEGSGGVIDIRLSPNGATVSGTVQNTNGDAVGDVLVTLGPEAVETAKQTLFLRTTRTDQDGKFTIKGLPPGDYRVLAWEEVDEQLVTDPEFRAHFDDSSAIVKLSENSQVTPELKLVPREAIESEAGKAQ